MINGADPNPGRLHDENGSNIRGEQNIGRAGGTGVQRARRAPTARAPPVTDGSLDEVLGGLLHANPFARTVG